MADKKIYVLDTNILINSPRAIYGFADNIVTVTATTLQELDGLKSAPGETGFKAREAIREIAALCKDNEDKNPLDGIEINGKSKGIFRIEPNGTSETHLPRGFSLDKPDNRIMNSTIHIAESNKKNPTILITNDISMRVNAQVCGIKVQGYKNDQLEHENTYAGRQTVQIKEKEIVCLYKLMDKGDKEFHSAKLIGKSAFKDITPFEPNEYVLFTTDAGQLLATRFVGASPEDENDFVFKIVDKNPSPMNVTARNVGQRMALDALMAPASEIPLVILKGKAGTAKTFLSLAAGLDATIGDDDDRQYNKVMITRTNTLSDADIGFLPGTLEEKMGPLVSPFMDNLESLLSEEKDEPEQVKMFIDDLMETDTIEICSIAYMRGRSLKKAYLIVDEAQNSTKNQIQEIITRAGEGTKIVLCGDPDQIDNPRLDRLNNGLAFASERMKGSKLCAQLEFSADETVRSELAAEGAVRLLH